MMAEVRKSSICAHGHQVNELSRSNHLSEPQVEFFGAGGVLELKSNKPRKGMIDMLTGGGVRAGHMALRKEWYLAELFTADISLRHFEKDSPADVYAYSDVLSWCLKILAESPTSKAMLREAIEKNWVVSLDDLHGGDYCLDVEQKLLILDNNALVPSALGRSSYFRNITLVTLIKALRDVWQEKRHGGFDEFYRPEHVMLMERVRAADCDLMTVLIAWELRASGKYADLWKHILGSDNGDMAMIFSGSLEKDKSSDLIQYALVMAFKQWFRSEARINACDHDTLEYMDEVLGGTDTQNPFGKKKPSKMSIEVLSCLPDKSAYLQGMGAEILADPLFSGMQDGINQTHLFHILYDLEAVIVENVPFRDAKLAARIFPVEDKPSERVR